MFTVEMNCGLRVMRLKDLLMIDWDPISPGESWDEGHTIHNPQEAIKLLELDCIKHPTHLWRCYETSSGGIHAFLMSHSLPPTKEACQFSYSLKGDKRYIDFAWQRQTWNVRICPKRGRDNDFVARYLVTIGSAQPLFNHVIDMTFHDTYIGKYNK